MDSSEMFVVVALVWALLGVSMALVMGRRGHQSFMWLVLGIVLGPLVLPLAANALHHDRPGLVERLSHGRPGPGSVDVIVGSTAPPRQSARYQRRSTCSAGASVA